MQTPEEQSNLAEPIEHHKKDQISNVERLAQEVADTKAFLKATFSFRMIVLRGVLTGFAIVVGSTVIASIIFALVQLVFGDVPYIPGESLDISN